MLVAALPPPAVADDGVRRRELAEFLRARRAQLQPEDVGLPRSGRRRTPGLRREEVAVRAGVGTTWYTWLEQARNVQASTAVLDALAEALCLSTAERDHLHRLGRRGSPPPLQRTEHVPPAVRRLVESLGESPACVIGRRWDFLAWNDAFAGVFGDPADLPPERRNRMWWFFTDPMPRRLNSDWAATARHLVAKFRTDCGGDVGDPWFASLIADLKAASPEFAELWPRHEVAGHGDGRKIVHHPTAGPLHFEHAVFHHHASPELKLVLYSPVPDEETVPRLQALLSSPHRRPMPGAMATRSS